VANVLEPSASLSPSLAAFTNLSKLLGKLGGVGEGGEERDLKERTAQVTAHTFVPLFLRLQV